MKKLQCHILIFCLLVACPSLHAEINYIPQLPINELPADNAIDQSIIPRFESSPSVVTDNHHIALDHTLESVDWIVYPISNVQLLGGFRTDEAVNISEYSDEASQEIEIGFNVEVNNLLANVAIIYPNGVIELVNRSDKSQVIATLDMEFDTTAISRDDLNFVKVLKLNKQVVVEWSLEDSSEIPEWSMTIQGYIDPDFLGFKLGVNSYSLDIKDKITSDSKIGVSIADDRNMYTLDAWGKLLEASDEFQFSYACPFNEASSSCISKNVIEQGFLIHINGPRYTHFTSDISDFKIDDAASLEISERYEYQVRYKMSVGEHNLTSNWSAPTQFLTRHVDVSYKLEKNGGAIHHDQYNEINFTLISEGPDDITDARVEFILPFDIKDVSLRRQKLVVKVNGSDQCREVSRLDETIISCSIRDVSVGKGIPINILVASPVEGNINIKHQACNIRKCSEVDYYVSEFQLIKSNTWSEDIEDPDSGAGSLFWLLMILPGLSGIRKINRY